MRPILTQLDLDRTQRSLLWYRLLLGAVIPPNGVWAGRQTTRNNPLAFSYVWPLRLHISAASFAHVIEPRLVLAIARSTNYPCRMCDYLPEQIEQQSFVNSAIVLPEIGSTSSYAKQLARSGEIAIPSVVIARNQTAGRGRGNKAWWSGQGSLSFTLLIPARRSCGLTSIAAALAVCETVREFNGQLCPSIKWPNDVMLGGKKLCGILIEKLAIQPPVTLIGIGVNTNCRLVDADEAVREIATSLRDITGRKIDQQQFMLQLLKMLNSWINLRPTKGIIDTFMNISQFKIGEPISVETSRFGRVSGKFEGIGVSGELILLVDGKPLVVESGINVTTI